MAEPDYYVVSRNPGTTDEWYCHLNRYPYMPVFGSIGSKEQAIKACRERNLDGRVRYG